MDICEKTFGRLGNRLFQSAYIYAQFRDGNIPDIYLQDCKYFDKYKDEIKQMFGEGIVPDERVAIHLRKGDYVGNGFYVDLSHTDYYLNAMNSFPVNTKFLIFSDDILEAEKLSLFWEDCDFSKGKTPSEDLLLMAGCKSIIMANSSLSWWGAYLGNHENVIYPKAWFSDGKTRVGFPSEWRAL